MFNKVQAKICPDEKSTLGLYLINLIHIFKWASVKKAYRYINGVKNNSELLKQLMRRTKSLLLKYKLSSNSEFTIGIRCALGIELVFVPSFKRDKSGLSYEFIGVDLPFVMVSPTMNNGTNELECSQAWEATDIQSIITNAKNGRS